MKYIGYTTLTYSKNEGDFTPIFSLMKLLYPKPDLSSYCGDFIV